MKKLFSIFFLILLISVIPHTAFNQIPTFEKHYDTLGCYYANCVRQSYDGGYVMFGSSYNSSTQQDVAILKTDSMGSLLWVKTYGGSSTDGAKSAVVTPDSNYLIVGLKDASINNVIWLLKINDSGDTLWTKTISLGQGDNTPTAIENTSDGGYILTGYTNTRGNGALDVYLIKLDINGDTLWAKTYGGTNSDVGYSVKQTYDSGFVIAGNTGSFGAGVDDFYVIKTDVNGDTIWTKTFGDVNVDVANSISQTSDSGYIISGYSWNVTFNNYDFYLIKLNVFGDSIWAKYIGDQFENTSENLQITSDGGYVLVGTTMTNNNSYDAFLVRTDSNGDTLWTKKFGGGSSEYGYFIQVTSDGGFVLTGSSDSYIPNSVYLVKTDNLGNIINSLDELESNNEYSVFPIPANHSVYVKPTSINSNKKVKYSFIDVYGKNLIEREINPGEFASEIYLDGLNSGIYFILIKEKGNNIHSYKIIVQH